nr:glycosyltransferase family 2 protein [Cellulomonas hominis]
MSVIVPLHNGGRYIAETLTSLQQQEGADRIEVVVVDDGSTDDGPDIVRSHPVGARLVRQPNRGVAAARNRGCLEASGTWLAFLDQDDLWHASRFARMEPRLRSVTEGCVLTSLHAFATEADRAAVRSGHANAEDLVHTWVPDDAAARALAAADSPLDLRGSEPDRHLDVEEAMRSTVSTTTSFFVRADHLRLAGGWSLHARSIDDWWLLTALAHLEPILVVDEPTHLYRVHAGATSRSTTFWYAYSSSLVALRYGGNYVPLAEALTTPLDSPTVRHMLGEMIESDQLTARPGAAAFTMRTAALLEPPVQVHRQVLRLRLRRAVPWLRPVVRAVRRWAGRADRT